MRHNKQRWWSINKRGFLNLEKLAKLRDWNGSQGSEVKDGTGRLGFGVTLRGQLAGAGGSRSGVSGVLF